MTALADDARVPPASMKLITYQQEVRDDFETRIAAGLLRDDAPELARF